MSIDQVIELMTPREVLELTEFSKALPILPERFPSFDHLVMHRGAIRNLSLLPVKSDEMRAYYNSLPKDQLYVRVLEIMGNRRFTLAENEYPYMTPSDTEQSIIWVKDPSESHEAVAKFIHEVLVAFEIPLQDVILFERPLQTATKLVKGTFPLVRHVHLWSRRRG